MIRRNFAVLCFVASVFTLSAFAQAPNASSPVGIFESQNDVGSVIPAGTADYDVATKTYHIAASGQNIWALHDDFHFAWKRISGDFAITADISFPDKSGPEHKKAVLMFRESLDPDSKYADVAVHGNGLTALQYRHEKGGVTGEFQLAGTAPQRLRLEKRGSYVYVYSVDAAGEFHPTGAMSRVSFDGPFYVGIGMCAHQADLTEKGTFAKVELTPLPNAAAQSQLYSAIDVIDMASLDINEVYFGDGRLEAPNWTHDGAFIFNNEGSLWRVPATGRRKKLHSFAAHSLPTRVDRLCQTPLRWTRTRPSLSGPLHSSRCHLQPPPARRH